LRIGLFGRFLGRPVCQQLPLVAPAWLHKCSMPVAGTPGVENIPAAKALAIQSRALRQ
jgi:hypothetical protein